MATNGRRSPRDGRSQVVETGSRGFRANALVGGVTTILLGLLPLVRIFAPFAGGALAGYRRNAGTVAGAKVGTAAGVVGAIGLDALAPPRLLGLVGGELVGGSLLFAIILAFVVSVVTSAFGGAVGAQTAAD